MKHVPLDVAAAICKVQPGTVRQWVKRGVVTRHTDGYDVYELLHWVDVQRRNQMIRDTRDSVAC